MSSNQKLHDLQMRDLRGGDSFIEAGLPKVAIPQIISVEEVLNYDDDMFYEWIRSMCHEFVLPFHELYGSFKHELRKVVKENYKPTRLQLQLAEFETNYRLPFHPTELLELKEFKLFRKNDYLLRKIAYKVATEAEDSLKELFESENYPVVKLIIETKPKVELTPASLEYYDYILRKEDETLRNYPVIFKLIKGIAPVPSVQILKSQRVFLDIHLIVNSAKEIADSGLIHHASSAILLKQTPSRETTLLNQSPPTESYIVELTDSSFPNIEKIIAFEKVYMFYLAYIIKELLGKGVSVTGIGYGHDCPRFSIQGSTDLCATWSLLIYNLFVLNPDKTRENIFRTLQSLGVNNRTKLILTYLYHLHTTYANLLSSVTPYKQHEKVILNQDVLELPELDFTQWG